MTTIDPADTHVEPPKMLPRDPRPMVETMGKWPFILLATVAFGALASVTVLPAMWSEEEKAPVYDPAPTRLTEPRGRREMPTDYSQVERPVQPTPAQAPQPQPTLQPQPQTVVQSSPRQQTGPTRAELLKKARMADLAPVGIGNGGGVSQVSMNGGTGGGASAGASGGRQAGKLYNPHSLTPGYDCQVDAGTNIPAMTEQRLTSESPGTVSAVATRDVWSADKTCLAIPRGSRFVGKYQTAVAEGQVRMGIIWTGITRPPPRKDSIELVDTVAGDPDGTAGVSGDVNNHFWRKLAYVTAASLLDIGKTAITASGEGGVGAAVAGIFASRAASPIDEWAKRQLDIPPVIEIEPREISIVLAQHLPMDDFRAR
jgi:type IV secretion system protein TrbI